MRLKYTILWIENELETVQLKSPQIKKHLDDLCFDLEIIPKEDDADLIKLLTSNDVNLILVDYNLQEKKRTQKADAAAKKTGDEIIDAIRRNRLYNEVVFYSAGPFRDRIRAQLEGVYYSNLEGLPMKAISIIDLTLKKNQDINNIRGMFIAETIDLENKLEDLINAFFGSDSEKKTVCEHLISPEFRVFEFSDKYKLMNIICKERTKSLAAQLTTLKDGDKRECAKKEMIMLERISSELAKIDKEIIFYRNILAHTSESNGNMLISYINKDKPITVNDEFCLSIRKNIKKHSENLDTVIKHLQTWKNC